MSLSQNRRTVLGNMHYEAEIAASIITIETDLARKPMQQFQILQRPSSEMSGNMRRFPPTARFSL
jgi:hypothetical protein